MSELFDSGRVADLILAVLVVEAVLLELRHRRTGREPGLRQALPVLLAGAFLALALRAALVDAAWPWIAASLVAAAMAHLAGLITGGGTSP